MSKIRKEAESPQTTVSEILSVLNGFQAGRFNQRLESSNDPIFKPLIDKLNETAQILQLRSGAQVRVQDDLDQVRFLNTISGLLPSLVSYMDRDLNYKYVNSAYEKWFGVSKEQCLKLKMTDVLGQSAVDAVRGNLDAAYAGEEQFFERTVPYKTGGHKHILVNYIPDRDKDGQVIGITVIASDMSGQKARENELNLVFETMTEGLTVQDSNAAIKQFNPAALSILGLSEEQLLGRTSLDPRWRAIKPDGSDFPGETHPAVVALKTGEKVLGVVMGIQLPSGETRWLRVNAVPFNKNLSDSSKNKEVVNQGVLVTFSNITETVSIKSRLDDLFRLSPDMICIAGVDGYFKEINPSFSRILGYSDGELLSQPFLSFIHPDDLPETLKEVEKLSQGSPTINFENRYKTKSGDYKILSWVTQSNPKTGELYAIARDVTSQRQTEYEIKLMLDALQIGIWKYNPANQSLHWDKSMYKLFEMNEADFGGHYQAWESLLTPDSKKKAVVDLKKALSGEKEFNTVFEVETQNKGKLHIAGIGKVVRNLAGEAVMMYGINFDVSVLKKAELEKERLQEELEKALAQALTSERSYREIFENMPVGIVKIGPDFRFLSTNPAFQNMVGYSEAELKVIPMPDITYHDDLNISAESMQLAFKNGFKSMTHVKRYIHKSGKIVWVRITSLAVEIQKEKEKFVIGMLEDITALQELQKEIDIERSKVLQQAKLASLGEMAGGVAHEINNPLAIIQAKASQLIRYIQDGKFSVEDGTVKLNAIVKTTERIEKIIKGLRSFSRNAEKDPLARAEVATLFENVLSLCSERFKSHEIRLEVGILPALWIECRATQIEQVILNLLNNAHDAVEVLPEKWVQIKVSTSGAMLQIRITDSGKGISPQVLDKLMQPFFTTKAVGKGTGLGLSISKGIIEEHGGGLRYDGSSGNTSFVIELPLKASGQSMAQK